MPNTTDDYYVDKPLGLSVPNSFQCPNAVVDELLPELTGSELKVLLYIVRRTFGFQKDSDNISLSQMLNGITTREGQVLDRGAGIKDKKTVLAAIRSLEERGIISTERRRSIEKGDEPTTYRLNLLSATQEGKTPPPVGEKPHQGGGGVSPPGPWWEFPPTQNPVLQNPVKQNIDSSNIRKAKSDEYDYVNTQPEENGKAPTKPTSEETEQPRRGRPPKTQREGSEENQRLSKNRRVEEQGEMESLPAREEMHKPQPKTTTASSPVSIGELLPQQFIPQPVPDDEAYEAIRDFIRDMAGKNHDEASLKSSTTRAYNLYQRAGVSLSYFFNLVYDADKEASRRSTTIKKRTPDGFTNRMAYFFAVLEDKLGLREKLPPASP